jgi:hypothetical protein
MKPKFTIERDEKIYLNNRYLCNGHWLVTREIAKSHVAPKAFKNVLNLAFGSYVTGYGHAQTPETTPDMSQVIPKRDGYVLAEQETTVAHVNPMNDEVTAYLFKAGDIEFRVAPRYVPLLRLGQAFAKDALSPILVLGGKTLNDEFIGVVMPLRK